MMVSKHPEITVLEVFLHDQLIGSIARLMDDSNVFAFHESYIRDTERPTLSLSFKSPSGELKQPDRRPTRTKLPPFFSNLLPEGHMREYLARQGDIKPEREFFLLGLLGSDLPGALTVREAQAQLSLLSSEEILSAQQAQDTNEPPKEVFRFSLAGVQMKFSAIEESRGGLTIPVHGTGGHWIVKLPSSKWNGVPENEYSMMKLAEAAGLKAPKVKLIATDSVQGLPKSVIKSEGVTQSLAVKRFDRGNGEQRIHIEDMAQVFGVYPNDKYKKVSYENIAKLLWLEAGEESLLEYVRVLVFNLLIGNADAHLKNWSLIYPDQRTPTLAPAYDLVSTIAYMDDDNEMGLSLAGTKKMLEISSESFEKFAKKADLPVRLVVKTAREMAARFEDAWKAKANELPMYPEVKKIVESHKSKIPLFREMGV